MDDGQERTFKVKFDGEGVDDYGGPYREVFAQIPVELQALKNTDGACRLALLQPTPNTQRGMEVDGPKFMLRPRIVARMYLELCTFLGRLVGMALRSKVELINIFKTKRTSIGDTATRFSIFHLEITDWRING